MKVRMFHGTTEISLENRMSQVPRIGEKVYARDELWEVWDVRYDMAKGRGIKEVYLHLRPIIDGVAEFNNVLEQLLEYFSDRNFDRTEKISHKEVASQERPDPIFFRSPQKGPDDPESKPSGVNIAYCPPNSYILSNKRPVLHVRVYDPNEAKGVSDLLKTLGLKPSIHDNDPYSKTDVDADLTII